jgi:hypothetical protein
MKFYFVIPFCAILIAACSLFPTATPTVVIPTRRNTSTPLPSGTPTVPSVTFTTTPTLIVFPKTDTPTVDLALTQATDTPIILVTPSTPTVSPLMKGFISVQVSDKEFFKDKRCQPTSVKFTVQVSEPARSAYVVLFVRLKGKFTGVTSEWTSITMDTKGAGTFTHVLTADEILGVASFQNPWVEYQLVTTQSNTIEVGRTDIFGQRLTLSDCKPGLTPKSSLTPVTQTP